MSLQEKLNELAEKYEVPGAVAGVIFGETTEVALQGVTNIEHPLPVDESTLFQFGSTGKTITATAVMVLVEKGLVDLEAPVRTYVPELTLKDEHAAANVTVLQLLNHTAGWAGDSIPDTGDGDDCLTRFVEKMAELDQVTPLGAQVSYNNASLCLAGQVIATVTGTTYEQAVRDLVLEPLGLTSTFGFAKDIMTRRFVSGHMKPDGGEVMIAKPWGLPRSGAPAGGWTATIGDQLEWARFHLGLTESTVISDKNRQLMQQPTVHMPGNALGDAVGISWLLEDVGGVTQVSHGGSTIGQLSDFAMVPEKEFAFVCMTNLAPGGAELYRDLKAWALEHYAGITAVEPELAQLSDADLAAYEGTYDTVAANAVLAARDGLLIATIEITDLSLMAEGDNPVQPEIPLALVAGEGDRYVVAEGEAKGMRGYFFRGDDGAIAGVNFSGRDMTKRP